MEKGGRKRKGEGQCFGRLSTLNFGLFFRILKPVKREMWKYEGMSPWVFQSLIPSSIRQTLPARSQTASRDLDNLLRKGALKKVGTTARSTRYVLADKLDIKRTNRT